MTLYRSPELFCIWYFWSWWKSNEICGRYSANEQFCYISLCKNSDPRGGVNIWPPGSIFELGLKIIKISILNNFHQNRVKFVAARALTRFLSKWPSFWPRDLVFDPTWPRFELGLYFIQTNIVTKFHEDRLKFVAARALTSNFEQYPYISLCKISDPRGGVNIWPPGSIFKLGLKIIKISILTNFHQDQTKFAVARALTSNFAKSWPPGRGQYWPPGPQFQTWSRKH